MNITLTSQGAVMLLTCLITARSTGTLFSKFCFMELEPLTLLAYRSLLAAVLLVPFLYPHLKRMTRREVTAGAVIGGLFYLTMVAELIGLQTTNLSMAAILENTSIVMVPLIAAALARRLPDKGTLLCCLLAFGGVAAMSWTDTGFYMAWGEWLMFLSAVFFSFNIIATASMTGGCDALSVGFMQVLTMGLLALVSAMVFETPIVPKASVTYESLFYLAIVCTSFGFTLQPLAQSRCSAETAGLLCVISPPIGMLLGVTILGEKLTYMHITGLFLVLFAIILYALISNNKEREMLNPE